MYLIIVAVVVIFVIIYKLKFPFWSKQPVFHYHNLKYWVFPPGIINHDKPKKNKFYDNKIYFNTYLNTPTLKNRKRPVLNSKIIYI